MGYQSVRNTYIFNSQYPLGLSLQSCAGSNREWKHVWVQFFRFFSFHLTTDLYCRARFSAVVEEGRKEGNVLFNNALNTFYLRLYGVRHMVKDHSDSERGNPLPPHRLLFPINSKGSFICTIRQTG